MFNLLTASKTYLLIMLGVLSFYLTGCGISKRTTVQERQEKVSAEQETPDVEAESEQPIPLAMDVSSRIENLTSIQKQLQNAHQEWQGTPYRYGGEGSNGIDCSAFTQQVFRDFFNKDLPRHTRSQLQEGEGIRRRSIKTGDLIFFKTGRRSLHVGISMGNGDFLHASVSSGVIVSNIAEQYWATRYLGARRVL
jgi:cell wall-associated NlpC family hydrolase